MIEKENSISVCFDNQDSPLYDLSQEEKDLLLENIDVIRYKKNERVCEPKFYLNVSRRPKTNACGGRFS